MNKFIQVFMVVFSVGFLVLILNIFDQFNLPLVGDWGTITNNFVLVFPYLILIFLGFYTLLQRGK